MGSVVAINLLTGEYVVGGGSPQALYMYRDTFAKKAEPTMWLDAIHWPTTRPLDEEIAEMVECFEHRRRSQRKRR
jgi:hypothetical protein